jgi:hypothetical protein
MKPEVTFEDWVKFKLIVGEVIDISESNVKINIGREILKADRKGDLAEGDKVVIGIENGKLIIPLINGSVIIPEKDIEVGCRIS